MQRIYGLLSVFKIILKRGKHQTNAGQYSRCGKARRVRLTTL
jgi:hypothetical protein